MPFRSGRFEGAGERRPEQEEIGLFYGLINAALQVGRNLVKLAKDQDLTANIDDSSRFFAQVFVTITDAQIGCWDSKYLFNFWRPVTAIQHADIDGNNATDPLGPTLSLEEPRSRRRSARQ